jgi:hypothetical protein
MDMTASDAPFALVGNRVFASRRREKHLCRRCLTARAGFIYRGRYRARHDHDLCQRCFRELRAGFLRWVAREFPGGQPPIGTGDGHSVH